MDMMEEELKRVLEPEAYFIGELEQVEARIHEAVVDLESDGVGDDRASPGDSDVYLSICRDLLDLLGFIKLDRAIMLDPFNSRFGTMEVLLTVNALESGRQPRPTVADWRALVGAVEAVKVKLAACHESLTEVALQEPELLERSWDEEEDPDDPDKPDNPDTTDDRDEANEPETALTRPSRSNDTGLMSKSGGGDVGCLLPPEARPSPEQAMKYQLGSSHPTMAPYRGHVGESYATVAGPVLHGLLAEFEDRMTPSTRMLCEMAASSFADYAFLRGYLRGVEENPPDKLADRHVKRLERNCDHGFRRTLSCLEVLRRPHPGRVQVTVGAAGNVTVGQQVLKQEIGAGSSERNRG